MEIKFITSLIFVLLFFSCEGDNKKENYHKDYSVFLINHFSKKSKNVKWFNKEIVAIDEKSLFKHGKYNISVSEEPLLNKTKNVILKNPYYNEGDKYNFNSNNYPISYSVVYENKLISLFNEGKFVCHNIKTLSRDLEFEKKLSSYNFQNFWLYNNKLIALYNNVIYEWEGNNWKRTDIDFPLMNSKKLYEDNVFVVFKDDFGEWGGTVYFFEKKTGVIFYTLSFNAKNVYKQNNKFYVVERINRGTKILEIEDPKKLSVADRGNMFKMNKLRFEDGHVNIGSYGYLDNSMISKDYSSFEDLDLITSFNLNGVRYYLANVYDLTFIAELKDNGKKSKLFIPFSRTLFFLITQQHIFKGIM